MTPQQAKELLPIITAFAEGKTIQVKSRYTHNWFTLEDLNFDCDLKEYRIKPEPREFWVNVYQHHSEFYDTKELADMYANPARLECIKVREVID